MRRSCGSSRWSCRTWRGPMRLCSRLGSLAGSTSGTGRCSSPSRRSGLKTNSTSSWRWWRMPFSLIRDKGREGRRGYTLPKPDVEMKDLETVLPKAALRKEKPGLAEVDEPTVVRHYTNLSRQNEGIDTTFYPLGSCTMKHNPRANEAAAVVPGFAGLHPLQPEAQAQGALRIMHELQGYLAEVSGLPHVSLQPLAGAQGELTSILMVKKFFEDAGD